MGISRIYSIATPALALSILLVQSAAAAPIENSYLGYSGDGTGGTPYVNVNGGGANAITSTFTTSAGLTTGTAAAVRNAFLGAMDNDYYYEDFQEVTGYKKSGSNPSSPIGYGFTMNSHGAPTFGTPGISLSTDVAGTESDVTFHQGAIGSARGAFDYDNAFDPAVVSGDLAAAVPNTNLTDDSNSFVNINPDKTLGTYDLTIHISPGENAIGLMLNDIVQPNKTDVIVSFIDGSNTTVDDITGMKPNSKGVLVAADLANNNDWFIGITGSADIASVTIKEASNGTPITLDNIYVGSVPLPSAAFGGAALLSLVAIARRRSSQA